MPDRYVLQQIQNWAADFAGGERARAFSGASREYAGEILTAFLTAACDHRGVTPGELEEADLRAALLQHVARLELPESAHRDVPVLAASFVEALAEEGRVADGHAAASFLRALAPAYREAAGASRTPHRRPSAKVSPNDPCPCGSGRKFKKCCQGMLG